jgi:uncharacterized membrane protein
MSAAVGLLRARVARRLESGTLLRYAPFAAGALLVAGIVHLSAVLLAPRMATGSLAARFSGGEANALRLLPPVLGTADTLPTPFADPALLWAACPYDLAEGPVRLRLQTGDQFLSVVVLSPTGRVLLALTDRAASRRSLNILLGAPSQLRQLDAQEGVEEDSQELRVRVTQSRGVALVRVLALREAERVPAAALLGRVVCRQE